MSKPVWRISDNGRNMETPWGTFHVQTEVLDENGGAGSGPTVHFVEPKGGARTMWLLSLPENVRDDFPSGDNRSAARAWSKLKTWAYRHGAPRPTSGSRKP